MSALPTDFNDLSAAQGLAAVREQLEPVIQGVADWPVPILTAAEPPSIPSALLPGWLGRYVQAIAEATQTPVTMSALFALSVVASCVQRRYMVAPLGLEAGYLEAAAFWAICMAASGSRKSAIVEALTEASLAWEKRAGDLMRREVAAHNSRPATKLEHTAGDAPNR